MSDKFLSVLHILAAALVVALLGYAITELPTSAQDYPAYEYAWATVLTEQRQPLRLTVTGYVLNDEGLPFEGAIHEWLNMLGDDGWELVTIVDNQFVFKRLE